MYQQRYVPTLSIHLYLYLVPDRYLITGTWPQCRYVPILGTCTWYLVEVRTTNIGRVCKNRNQDVLQQRYVPILGTVLVPDTSYRLQYATAQYRYRCQCGLTGSALVLTITRFTYNIRTWFESVIFCLLSSSTEASVKIIVSRVHTTEVCTKSIKCTDLEIFWH